MSLRKKIERGCSIIILCLVSACNLLAAPPPVDDINDPVTLGQWHANLTAAKTYSEQNDIPLLYVWGVNGCAQSGKLDVYINNATFQQWQAERELVMVYIKASDTVTTDEKEFAQHGVNGSLTEYPFVAVYWQSKNTQPFNFSGRYPASSNASGAQQLIDEIEFYVDSYVTPIEGTLSITGASAVPESSTGIQYEAILTYDDLSTTNVTASTSFSENSVYASVSNNFLTTFEVEQDENITITAIYEGKTAQKAVVIENTPLTVELLVVSGPASVDEGETAYYTCRAYFSDESSADVTAVALWSTDLSAVEINGGELTVGSISSNQSVTVTAVYGGQQSQKMITAYDTVPSVELLVISGPATVDEGTTVSYICTAYFSDESSSNVTVHALWSEDSGYATISVGELTALEVSSDQTLTIIAVYEGVSGTKAVTIVDLPQGLPYLEGFESGMGLWHPSASSEISWTRTSGGTPTADTGPAGASEGAYYIYIEASGSGNYNKTAAVEASFSFASVTMPQLSFDYHMYGAAMGALYVDIYDGSWHEVWNRVGEQHTGESESWSQADVDLSAYAGSADIIIRLRGVTGTMFLSDMAVDNISLSDQAPGAPEPYWYWTEIEEIPANLRGHEDTPAGDNIPNLLKYACGLPALTPATTADLMSIGTPSGANTFAIRYYRSKSAVDVTLVPIWVAALSGSWLTTGVTLDLIADDGEREQWKASITAGESGFMRLRAVSSE